MIHGSYYLMTFIILGLRTLNEIFKQNVFLFQQVITALFVIGQKQAASWELLFLTCEIKYKFSITNWNQ